ncbi:MAG: radical SAM protein [Candidatus Nitrosocosmicus sp.]|nr:radical SAM protein [Candidatus Nitrosocosmicus sp.]
MKSSKYNIFIKGDNEIYGINLLSRSSIEFSLDAYNVFMSLDKYDSENLSLDDPELNLFIQNLKDSMFIIEDDFDEIAYIRYRSNQERFDKRQLGLVITPTMGCNFSCHYCFENKDGSYLDNESQNRILKLVAHNIIGKESLNVQWFGGEPLLALPIIENLSHKLMILAEKARVEYSATVITNGALMTEQASNLLHKMKVKTVQITLDGDRTLHNRTRFENHGDKFFDVILNNIRQASKLFSIKLRVHVSPFNIPRVVSLIDTLEKEGMKECIDELYFSPLFNYRQGNKLPQYIADGKKFMNAEEFAKVQLRLAQKAHKLGFKLSNILDTSYGICTAVRENTLVIDASGNLLKCYKDVGDNSQAMGTLEKGITPNNNLLKWMDISVPRDAECQECKFLPICLGGCSKQWQENAPKEVICTPLKFNADEMLRLYVENIKK